MPVDSVEAAGKDSIPVAVHSSFVAQAVGIGGRILLPTIRPRDEPMIPPPVRNGAFHPPNSRGCWRGGEVFPMLHNDPRYSPGVCPLFGPHPCTAAISTCTWFPTARGRR